MLRKCILTLFNITHLIQQLTCLLEPPPRSFRVSIYAEVIFSDFGWGKSVYGSNFPHASVIVDAKPRENTGKQDRVPGAKGTPGRKGKVGLDGREWGDKIKMLTQDLPCSVLGHPLTYLPEINPSSCST